MRLWVAMLGLVLGCESGGSPGTTTAAAGSAKPSAGSGKGFGEDLLRELEGSGSDSKPAAAGSAAKVATDPKADAKAGSADAKVDAKAGSADAKAGSADAKPDAKAGSAAKVADAKPDPKADAKPDPKADAKPDPKAGSAAKVAADPKPDPKAGSAAKPADAGTKVATPEAKPPVMPANAAELKQIKLALLPNWDRDADEVGTISLAVKVQGRPQPAVFRFRYGYEDARAPMDRDAYKKWLADNKVLVVKQDRQAGAAWFIEGTDGSGAPSFRIVVNYGGRKLICGGSLYKDAESNKLGDLRDQTIIQAKQICESVAL